MKFGSIKVIDPLVLLPFSLKFFFSFENKTLDLAWVLACLWKLSSETSRREEEGQAGIKYNLKYNKRLMQFKTLYKDEFVL